MKKILFFPLMAAILAAAVWLAWPAVKTLLAVIQNDKNVKSGPVAESDRQRLDLSGQRLSKLPAYVLAMTSLTELNLANNQLSGALPAEIRQLKNLKKLDASNNLMTGIPAEIGQLSELTELDFSNNQITGLPYEIGHLAKLKKLNLSGNKFSELDLEVILRQLPRLTVVR